MCGRYTLRVPFRVIHDQLSAIISDALYDIDRARYNVAPSQDIPIARIPPGRDERVLEAAKWGLLPAWAKDPKAAYTMINARKETVAEKPAYRSAFKSRRCLIPADGFYEWRQEPVAGRKTPSKIPYHFRLAGGEVFCFAGLWEENQWGLTSTLITTEPNEVVKIAHDRMPVILPREKYTAWLDPRTPQDELQAMLVPYPAELMDGYAVSSLVSSPRNEGPELVKPA